MPSASLAVPYRLHSGKARVPDKVRVAGLSAAIALNLVVLLAALRPLEPQLMTALSLPQAITVVWNEPPPPPPPPPPPIELQALPTPTPAPITHAPPVAVTPPVVTPLDTGSIPAPPVVPTIAPATPGTPVSQAPIEASLAYMKAPIHFPTEAIRRHLQGTVLLRVLVDENGKPVDVAIEKSSGSRLLDQSARSQVLAGWQFQPAMVDGQHVRAWARVPVTFDLRDF